MKTLKSLVLSAVTAATTLVFVAISGQAQAFTICSGVQFNGPVLNGIQFNGPVIQGPILQGPILQGPVIQGPLLQGPVLQWAPSGQAHAAAAGPVRVGQPVAVTLASGRTVKVK